MTPRKILLVATAALVLAVPAQARAIGQIELVNTVSIEVEVAGADGTKAMHLSPASTVTPGTLVVYAIAYRNTGANPAADIVINNPLPDSVEYVAPFEGEAPLVSVDGSTFKPMAELQVALAEGGFRPAIAADVRHVRWTLPGSVGAGQEGRVAFRARLK